MADAATAVLPPAEGEPALSAAAAWARKRAEALERAARLRAARSENTLGGGGGGGAPDFLTRDSAQLITLTHHS